MRESLIKAVGSVIRSRAFIPGRAAYVEAKEKIWTGHPVGSVKILKKINPPNSNQISPQT